jgi:hypothetical protein
LREFADLFPEDIPAITEAGDKEDSFIDGSFPKKLQLESSKVQHKIVLTDPNAVPVSSKTPCRMADSTGSTHQSGKNPTLDQPICIPELNHSQEGPNGPSPMGM